MESHGRTTLRALLSIKVQRERSLRSLLATYTQQESELLDRKSTLLEQRHQHWENWRQQSAIEQQLNHTQLQLLKRTLASYSEKDLHFAEKLDELQAEWQQLQVNKSEQQSLLCKNLLEQEKLRLILE
ncbi:hypothetical protein [Pseudomonas chlororaphis]|uniref:hypothetical protein n=1 Tax=Pseudomonas chlororaphis TaxID=587753 RepID=UPI0015DF74AD|nr:hypothetical protein [Pseudomonas chlororaphis]QLL13475.1 hypothetical protein H0I86_31725 [Pseudomonas chlororaphis subsp. aurantiaca]